MRNCHQQGLRAHICRWEHPCAMGSAVVPLSPALPSPTALHPISSIDSHPAATRRECSAQRRIPIKLNYSGVRNVSPHHLSSFMYLVPQQRQIIQPSIRKGENSKACRVGEWAAWHRSEQPQQAVMLGQVSTGQGSPGVACFQGMLFCLFLLLLQKSRFECIQICRWNGMKFGLISSPQKRCLGGKKKRKREIF